jgi:hypothetical protein
MANDKTSTEKTNISFKEAGFDSKFKCKKSVT